MRLLRSTLRRTKTDRQDMGSQKNEGKKMKKRAFWCHHFLALNRRLASGFGHVRIWPMKHSGCPSWALFVTFMIVSVAKAISAEIALPSPLGLPAPGPTNDAPYAPQPIVQGGVIVPLYSPDSPLLRQERVREAEQYNLSKSVPGRINSIVNIHNPSIEVHTVDGGINTGTAVILAAGGGHNTLNVGSESADFVPYFYNYGVNTVILRYRLRRDGYNVQNDAVNDAFQAIRLVRAHARDWNFDP